MKTRLLAVLFCLLWLVGCGNRDPNDVETGYGPFETASLLICNNSNCVGGPSDGQVCADDLDCGAGGTCEIFVPIKVCEGGSVAINTPCETDLECGQACDAGPLLGDSCFDDTDCRTCDGGVSDGDPCDTENDCFGECMGGSISADGFGCQSVAVCGGLCDTARRIPCQSDLLCQQAGGTFCDFTGVECLRSTECVQSGGCTAGVCQDIGQACHIATSTGDPRLNFDGLWDSCQSLDHYLMGTTGAALPMSTDGLPVVAEVSGCNSATLEVNFRTAAGVPMPGCVELQFNSHDRSPIQQCGTTVNMDVDLR